MRQLKITQQITNRSTMSLDKYLQEVNKQGMITPEEEVELAVRIRAGDERALDKMVRANLRFVVSVAKQYQNQGLTLPDLINEGNLGLIKAARRFDETKGFKFISFAVWWIRQSILQGLADQARIVRIPLNKIGTMNKINRTYCDLEQQLQRQPTEIEIADALDMDVKTVTNVPYGNRHVSLDAPLGTDENSSTLLDMIANERADDPDHDMFLDALQLDVQRTLATLPQKEQDVIKLYYGIGQKRPMSYLEIGNRMELTRERVRQIKEHGIRKLKTHARSRLLKMHLG